MTDDKALVLFSGGQDSTTCLAWALDRFARVETVGFAYGQRHAVELDARPRILDTIRRQFPHWAGRLGDDHVLTLDVLKQIGGSALTEDRKIEMGVNGLPTTFVPGRNILFLTTAAALAYRRGITNLVGGMCETDFSGYPDCHDEAIKAMQAALNLGMDSQFEIHTPLMWLDKASTWKLAHDLGGQRLVDVIMDQTVTCYHGDHTHRHAWGFGCGECPACDLRAKGWTRYAQAQGGLQPIAQRSQES